MTQNDIATKKNNQQKKALLANLNGSIAPLMKELQNDQKVLQMPELALRCAQFFHSISQYCVSYYNKFKDQQQIKKTKQIKKQQREKKQKSNRGRGRKTKEQRQLADSISGVKLQPPKKPLTAYIIYFQDKKPVFVDRYPSLNLSELTKLIAKEWKQLTQADKQVYLDRASSDRKRYQEQIAQFKKFYGKIALPIVDQLNIIQQKYQQKILEEIINSQAPLQIEQMDPEYDDDENKQLKNDEEDINDEQEYKSQEKQVPSEQKNDNDEDNEQNDEDNENQQQQNQQDSEEDEEDSEEQSHKNN